MTTSKRKARLPFKVAEPEEFIMEAAPKTRRISAAKATQPQQVELLAAKALLQDMQLSALAQHLRFSVRFGDLTWDGRGFSASLVLTPMPAPPIAMQMPVPRKPAPAPAKPKPTIPTKPTMRSKGRNAKG